MGKCIIFSRVSTIQQDLTQQTREVESEAARMGYRKESLIYIEHKESAIKLSIDERMGIQELKNTIENNADIDCIIIYEISRLSRQATMLYEIRDYLIEHNIQLVCMKPYMRLLEDGKMSQTASILFSLFASISESEMMIRKERLMRGKMSKWKQNLNGGGQILLGYEWDENGQLSLSDRNAPVIRKIFDMYEKGYSQFHIAKELMETGELKSATMNAAKRKVLITLTRREYCGERTENSPYLYPAIITKTQFEKCRKIASDKYKPHSRTTCNALCKGLVFAKHNGWQCTPHKGKNVYLMESLNDKSRYCMCIDDLDKLVWELVVEHIKKYGDKEDMETKNRIMNEANTCVRKVQQGHRMIKELEAMIKRTELRIIEGKMSEERGDKIIEEKTKILKQTQKDIDEQNYLYSKKMEWLNTERELIDSTNKKETIKHVVEKIILEKGIMKGHYTIYINMKDGKVYVYNYRKSGKYLNIEKVETN